MKRILLYLMLAVSGMMNAQIVDIPDTAFKELLLSGTAAKDINGDWIYIDSNDDGEIQVSEAAEVWGIIIDEEEIQSIEGLESFANLHDLTLVNYSGPCDFTQFTALTKLRIKDAFNPANFDGISSLVNLRELAIDTFDHDIEVLDLSGMMEIEILSLALWNANDNMSLIIGDKPNLETVELWATMIDEIELGDLPSLYRFEYFVPIATIDLSGATALEEIEVEFTESINLRNGKTTYNSFHVIFNGSSGYACIDEGEEPYLANLIISNGLTVNTYCSYAPGGDYNTISGTLTMDADNNGCGGSDAFSPLVKVKIDDGTEEGYAYTNFSGEYDFYTQADSFILTPEFDNGWFTATPATATVNLATVDNSTTTQDFCLTANGVHPDLAALIMPFANAQPGFDGVYKVVYFNKGNQTISGSVFFSFDDARMDYVSALPADDFISGNVIGWNYTDLKPFESRVIMVTLNANSPQETPAVNIGDILPFSVTVMPTTGDETPDDNQFLYDETVIGAFDPNDITCLEGEVAGPDMIGEYLHYNINFENTGDAAATFIVVKQVIDEAQFDVSTLQPLNTSHDVTVKVEGNVVEYRFDDIDLGPLEKGNIVFKIKSLNSLQVGDDVMQKAEIFFDYNWPIVTNEAVTVFEVLGTGDYEFDDTVKIYPNPVKDNLNITAGHDLKSIALYDLQGRLLQTALVNGTDATLNMSDRAAGIYFVKVTTDKGVKVEKIINE